MLAKPLGADLRMIRVGPVTTREARPDPQERSEHPRRDGLKENRQAPVDNGEPHAAFSGIVNEGGLLQDPVGLRLHSPDRLEHIEPMALIIHGQFEKKRAQLGSQDLLDHQGFVPTNPGRCMPPELPDSVQRPRHSSVAIDERQAPAEFLSEQVEEIPPTVELHQVNRHARRRDLHLGTGPKLRVLLTVAGQD